MRTTMISSVRKRIPRDLNTNFENTNGIWKMNEGTEAAEAHRRRLPERVILLRHGESEANADHTLYRTKADNLILLSEKGCKEAAAAGERIRSLLSPKDQIYMIVSPFKRTMQTAGIIRNTIEPQLVRYYIEPLIREQEFGNIQGDDFENFRREQSTVGRFYYRFPTGESGADVYGRAKQWWDSSLLRLNQRPGYPHCDAAVIVTHGLTMRCLLMQLFGWSPNTFNTVWNANNCEMYVLKKDLSKPGFSPYVLDIKEGDVPRSSLMLVVHFKDGGKKKFELNNYLSLPPPRTCQSDLVLEMLREQYGLDPDIVEWVDFRGGGTGYGKGVELPSCRL